MADFWRRHGELNRGETTAMAKTKELASRMVLWNSTDKKKKGDHPHVLWIAASHEEPTG